MDYYKGERFKAIDPIEFACTIWPTHEFWSKQLEVIESVEYNNITVVPSCNKGGKDFVAGHIALSHFLRYPECRVICTSVKDDHLRVLFAEIQRFIETARFPLIGSRFNGLRVLHRDIRKFIGRKQICPISYMRGMVSLKGEGLAGHHAAHTLGIIDEASGVDDIVFTQMETWAQHILVIGNPLPCSNFFYKAVKEGDIPAITF